MARINHQIVHFRLVEMPLPELAEGQFLVKMNYLSVEAA
jgi:NADPH-dependent curcumin reductase CurA